MEWHFLVQQRPPRHRSDTLVGWLPPKENFIKLDTDGSFDPALGTACTGGLIRDHSGRWLGGFHRNMTANSMMAELWALRDGLSC